MEAKPRRPSLFDNVAVQIALCVGGILFSFLLYGIVQEKIMTKAYGTDANGDPIRFTFSAWLVLNNRLVAIVGAVLILLYQGKSLANGAPIINYFGISLSNVAATYCQYESLKSISFPTQTLGKCGKMIPVMILGWAISGKRYNFKDYLMALGITTGCMLFLLTGDITGASEDKSDTPLGLFLMMGYLFSDGFTSILQEKLFRDYTVSTYSQMLWDNICSAVLSFGILLFSGELFQSFAFGFQYPALLFDAFVLSLCAFAGKAVIYYTIKYFGALVFSAMMTTRQFLSILLSCIIFMHSLSMGQWIGTVIVFGVLYYQLMGKKSHGHGHGGSSKQPATALSGKSGGDIESGGAKGHDEENDLEASAGKK